MNEISGRDKLVSLLVLFLIFVAWLPGTLQLAVSGLDTSLKDAAVVFGISRALNGLISVFQSTEVSMLIITVGIGELLDPLNDLVERFSELMTVALASIALQKLLLMLTSNMIFSALLTASGAALIYALWRKTGWKRPAAFSFVSLVFLRLSLTAVVLLNSAVDSYIRGNYQQSEVAELRGAQDILSQMQKVNETLSANIESVNSEIEARTKRLLTTREQIQRLETEITSAKQQITDCPLWKKIAKKCSADDLQVITEIEDLETELKGSKQSAANIAKALEESEKDRDCLLLRQNGEACSLWEKVQNVVPNYKDVINGIPAKLEKAVSSLLSLMAIFVAKTIILPILFWWVTYLGLKELYRRYRS